MNTENELGKLPQRPREEIAEGVEREEWAHFISIQHPV